MPDSGVRAPGTEASTGSRDRGEFIFAVQGMHCAACISTVERTLSEAPGVLDARVNLTQRRVRVDVVAGTDPDELALRLSGAGYDATRLDAGALRSVSTDAEAQALLIRLGVAGFGFANVMIFSVVVWSGAEGTTRDLMHWLSALIATPVICYSAQPFLRSAFGSLRRLRLNMDVPISLAILLATGQSLFETQLGGPHAYFEAALALTFFLLAGRYLDMRTRSTARSAAQDLSSLEPDTATVIGNGQETEMKLATIGVGDLLVVRPGDRIPLDGIVQDGDAELDNSFLTGESRPHPVAGGDRVAAGQFVHTGRLVVEVTAVGEQSSLRRLIRLIELAESGRNRYTNLADRAAAVYVPAVHLLALTAFAAWMHLSGDLRLSLNIAVAVLIITCPCALGLAVPAVSTAATGRFFRNNLLVKEPDAIEVLSEVRTAVIDKTGTLTAGTPTVDSRHCPSGEHLAVAAALAGGSNHPYSRAILDHVRSRGIAAAEVADLKEFPGKGVAGFWNGREVRLGRANWTGAGDVPHSAAFLKVGSGPAQEFRFRDRLRDGAGDCIKGLNSLGVDVVLMSGDSRPAVSEMANRLNIAKWHANALPEDKMRMVRELCREGRTLMVGDGLNDTAALRLADVSMSPASALDVSRVSAGIVIIGNLDRVPEGIRLARLARMRILQNFAIAAIYNAVAVPVAMLGFATPLAAAIAMSTSSIAVTLNSMRMR